MILAEHARAQKKHPRKEFCPPDVAVKLRALCLQDAAENGASIPLQNLGYILLYGIGGEADVVRGIDLLRRADEYGLSEVFVLVDPSIFIVELQPLRSLAYEVMRRTNNWQGRQTLVAWLSEQIGASIFVESR